MVSGTRSTGRTRLVSDPASVARAVRDAVGTGATKPVLATMLGADDLATELGTVPAFSFPEPAATALARATAYGAWSSRARTPGPSFEPPDLGDAPARVAAALAAGEGWLRADVAEGILAAAGIACLPGRIATTADQARRAAGAMGYPLVLKAVGPDIVHKRDVGGVRLDVRTEAELLEIFEDFQRRLGPRLSGVLVQPFMPGGVELLVGTHVDAVFGPVVVCGLGGTMVELMHDVSARLAPASALDIADMIGELKGVALLRGYRGSPPVDEPAVRDLVARVSALADQCPALAEMDLNPVIARPNGVQVIDWRMRLETVGQASRRR